MKCRQIPGKIFGNLWVSFLWKSRFMFPYGLKDFFPPWIRTAMGKCILLCVKMLPCTKTTQQLSWPSFFLLPTPNMAHSPRSSPGLPPGLPGTPGRAGVGAGHRRGRAPGAGQGNSGTVWPVSALRLWSKVCPASSAFTWRILLRDVYAFCSWVGIIKSLAFLMLSGHPEINVDATIVQITHFKLDLLLEMNPETLLLEIHYFQYE